MIPASRFGGLNHVMVANPNAANPPIAMSASGGSGKYLLDQSITESVQVFGRRMTRLSAR